MNNSYTLVTGGTSGIGFETAKQLKQAGQQVIITGQNSLRVAEASQSLDCLGFVADSNDLDSIQTLANDLKSKGISLNGLVLNAGMFQPQLFSETSIEVFDQHMNVNTKGVFFTLQALLPVMNNPSSVVFVSSIVVEKGFANCAAYAASKAAGEAMIRVTNMELADQGIRINIVRPGVTATPIQTKAGMDDAAQQALFSALDGTPLGRVLTPRDQAEAITFLLSDASLAMRNAVIQVDGGYCL